MFSWLRRSSPHQVTRTPSTTTSSRPIVEVLEDRLQPSASFDLGAAGQFGVLGLVNTQINNSNVTITGNEGVSQGGTLTNMAPSTITGAADEYAAGQYSGPGKLGGGVVVDPALMQQAVSDAQNAAAQAAALTPTLTLGSITSPTTITGNGGLNVISINGNITNSLILNGTASDVFVVNVSGTVTFTGNAVLGLSGGVTANNVLYNFTGASGNITSHVGNVFNGTLLALNYSFNLDGTFNGEIIGGGKSIALLSGAHVNQNPFSGVTSDQSPSSLSGNVKDGNGNPMANVQITLTGTNSQNQTVTLTTYTDSLGNYSFSGLLAGSYTVSEQPPLTEFGSMYLSSQSFPGEINGSGAYGNANGTSISTISIGSGVAGTQFDFINYYGTVG